jgi:ParB-like chromosome segregation protein Spo0J
VSLQCEQIIGAQLNNCTDPRRVSNMNVELLVSERSDSNGSSNIYPKIGGEGRVILVAVTDLLPADSPRLDGEDPEHVRVLAESDAELPPIVVHRGTGRVIDGMHRLRAATLRGADRVPVVYLDGESRADLFVLSVKANMAHGLPLTMADRQAAAQRIVRSHPQWSDRVIASVTGLSDKTVGSLRGRTAINGPRPEGRIGQDGRVRPLSGIDGRRRAGELMRTNPKASLRQIARDAGVSLGTAHDVRKRLAHGQDLSAPRRAGRRPVPGTEHATTPFGSGLKPMVRRRREASTPEPSSMQNPAIMIRILMKDPALRYTDSGRALLGWLNSRTVSIEDWARIVETVPPHCARMVAAYARRVAESWAQFASKLEQREETILLDGQEPPGNTCVARAQRS